MNKLCVVFVTCGSSAEARKISQALVKERLAACVNILPGVNSFFFWEGKLSREKEFLLMIKTQAKLFTKLATRVKQLHSYQVPEIIALPVLAGEKNYINWLKKETGG